MKNTERVGVLKTYKLYIDGKFPRTESGRYFLYQAPGGKFSANLCHASRKDFRDAVSAAKKAFPGWAGATAFNRGQILYRIAEMLEGCRLQLMEELEIQGATRQDAERELNASIDRLVYYAGWTDKYQQVFGSINPVASSHFNFSTMEPTGVVAVLAPQAASLLGLITAIAPVIAGGNSCVVLASETLPLCAITFAEVLHSSDVPAGVVNILTGFRKELLAQFASHMEVNAVIYVGSDPGEILTIQQESVENVKRVVLLSDTGGHASWFSDRWENPYLLLETQETKTTWHPVGI